jgi:hypothetical protein
MLKAVWSSLMEFYMIKNYKPEYIVDIATGSSVGTLVMNVALCLPIMKPF